MTKWIDCKNQKCRAIYHVKVKTFKPHKIKATHMESGLIVLIQIKQIDLAKGMSWLESLHQVNKDFSLTCCAYFFLANQFDNQLLALASAQPTSKVF